MNRRDMEARRGSETEDLSLSAAERGGASGAPSPPAPLPEGEGSRAADDWVAVLRADDVEPGRVAVVEVDGKRLAVCRTAEPCGDGEYFVIADVCTHDGGALDQGELIGCEIECPRHGARFDVTTGKVKRLPAVRPVKSYPARVVDGQIEVEVT